MTLLFRTLYAAAILVLALIAIVGIAAIGAYYYVAPSLPAVDSLKQVQLQVPLRVYTRDGLLLAEYGEQRRIPLEFRDIPDVIQEAFLAAEDDRFYHHPGVDYQGLLRATFALAVTGERAQGGGTITMQVARNFFLTREKTISRKVREIFLALRIERQLSKQEILTLYLNKIFLGQRAYGVGAAAEVYFGKSVHDLTLAEAATIAGLPKAPSRDNPVSSPDRALSRRAYVLRRMLETGYIDQASFQQANAEPMKSMVHGPTVEVDAPYVGEFPMVLECQLIHHHKLGLHTQFVGQIEDVKVDKITKRFGSIVAVDGIEFEVKRSRFVAHAARLDAPEVFDHAGKRFVAFA